MNGALNNVEKVQSGLSQGWWMFFETFWALVLGFILSGAVQAFVTRRQMKKLLGDHKPSTIVKASFFGAVSSSCSYAASALAKSIFSKGADFTASMVFMFASTNLVLELGLVLWILIGWQFALAEFIGGTIMIILLTILIPRVIPRSMISKARGPMNLMASGEEMKEEKIPFLKKLTSLSHWRDAAGYTIGDFTMLRVELVVGFIVAGLAAAIVPNSFWNSLFITGHGFLSSLENVLIAPFIAFISFVCSVGNVPLAAALWHGGISFGGTVAFIFADLLALPLVLIYRKYYGLKLSIRLALLFWFVMSTSGLITEGIFNLLSITPTRHIMEMEMRRWGANYTTYLNVIALIAFIVIYWLYKTKRESNSEFAKDYVCGMQVRISDAPAEYEFEGKMYYFCMPGCQESFAKDPVSYIPA